MANGTELADSVIKEIARQIEKLPDDDPMRLLLIINQANYKELNYIKKNPAYRFGEMFRDVSKSFTLLLIIIGWIMIVVLPNLLFRLITTVAGIEIMNFIK